MCSLLVFYVQMWSGLFEDCSALCGLLREGNGVSSSGSAGGSYSSSEQAVREVFHAARCRLRALLTRAENMNQKCSLLATPLLSVPATSPGLER